MQDPETDHLLNALFRQEDLADLGFTQKVLAKIQQKRLFRASLVQTLILAIVEACLIGASLESNLISDPLSALGVVLVMLLVLIIWFDWGPEGPLAD